MMCFTFMDGDESIFCAISRLYLEWSRSMMDTGTSRAILFPKRSDSTTVVRIATMRHTFS